MFQWLGRLPLRPRAWLRPPLSPRRATDLSLRPGEHGTWSPATVVSGRPMVQLFAEVDVMNTSECRLVLVSARLRKPGATPGRRPWPGRTKALRSCPRKTP